MFMEDKIQKEIDSWSGFEQITIAEDTLRALLHRRTIITLTDRLAQLCSPEMATLCGESEDYEWQVDILIYGLKAANTPHNEKTLILCIDTLRRLLSYSHISKILYEVDEDEDRENYPSYQKYVEDIITKLKGNQHDNPVSGDGSESATTAWHARR